MSEVNTSQPGKAYLDITEARARYGESEAWWRKVVYLKQMPYSKRGARVVFAVADIEAYFDARRVPAKAA